MPSTYTAYKLNSFNHLSHKEHLNNVQEVEEWLTLRNFCRVVIVEDSTGKAKQGYLASEGWYNWSKFNV